MRGGSPNFAELPPGNSSQLEVPVTVRTVSMESKDEEHRRLINEALRRVGRNVLAFQEIESRLKFLLPYMHPDGSAKGENSRLEYRVSVQARTLGHLTTKFLESVEWDAGDAKDTTKWLDWLVESRNQLVHHLLEIPGTSLFTTVGCRALIRHLDAQYRASQTFDRSLSLMALGLITGMRESSGPDGFDPELEQLYWKFREATLPGAEFVNLTNPADTEWRTTRIVRLLQSAEADTPRADGMTSLARAGELIKRADPTLKPKDYGLKSWLEVLKASELFEVIETPHKSGKGVTILYRTSIPLQPDRPRPGDPTALDVIDQRSSGR